MANLATTLTSTPPTRNRALLSPLGQRLLAAIYDYFVGWQQSRVLDALDDETLRQIGGKREASGRISGPVNLQV